MAQHEYFIEFDFALFTLEFDEGVHRSIPVSLGQSY